MASSSLSLAFLLLVSGLSSSSGVVESSFIGISPTAIPLSARKMGLPGRSGGSSTFRGATAPSTPTDPPLGGRQKVRHVESNMEVQLLGRFCVDEYNKKQAEGALRFRLVFEAEQQLVAGMMYYLKIEAEARGVKKYEAIVWVAKWLHSKKMLLFQPAAGL